MSYELVLGMGREGEKGKRGRGGEGTSLSFFLGGRVFFLGFFLVCNRVFGKEVLAIYWIFWGVLYSRFVVVVF